MAAVCFQIREGADANRFSPSGASEASRVSEDQVSRNRPAHAEKTEAGARGGNATRRRCIHMRVQNFWDFSTPWFIGVHTEPSAFSASLYTSCFPHHPSKSPAGSPIPGLKSPSQSTLLQPGTLRSINVVKQVFRASKRVILGRRFEFHPAHKEMSKSGRRLGYSPRCRLRCLPVPRSGDFWLGTCRRTEARYVLQGVPFRVRRG